MKHYLLRIVPLVAIGISGIVQAVTLGQARVNSFLNQPLDAEIAVIGLADGQHQDLRLRIANQEHFDRLGISYQRFLSGLSFDVVQSGGQWIVRARSSKPISETFIDFPLQMTWPGGQMIKQYTLLLDPPRRIQPARTARAARTAQTAPPVQQRRAPTTPGPQSYGPVQRGETLWPIAQKLKPRGITTQQMAMALLRANPQAFIDGNVNKLRAGVTLAVPPRDFIEQMDAVTARAEFTAQTRRWQAPVATSPRALEGAAPVPAARPTAAEDRVAGEAARPTQQADSDAQLRIVTEKEKPDAETANQQELKEQLLVTMEEIESNRITTAAIESRLAGLESEIDRMQKLLELKDAQIAALQSEVSAREAIQQAARASGPAAPQLPGALGSEGQTAAVGAPPLATTTAPAAVARIEAVPVAGAAPPGRPWYEQYLWLAWVLVGLFGLSVLLLLMRRPQVAPAEAETAGLPVVNRDASAAFRAEVAPAAEAMLQAEEDLRIAAQQVPPSEPDTVDLEELPELNIRPARGTDDKIDEGITGTRLDAMLDGSKGLTEHPQPGSADTEFSDDDIASWVAELGAEVDRAEGRSANDEQLPLNEDDIPSILTELDDQLTSADKINTPQPSRIDLEPVDEATETEDDTFTMSLDLARAYLEIGDQGGAKDMLKQALSGARNPEHRRQIEELLRQID